jgi:hypothetical protein
VEGDLLVKFIATPVEDGIMHDGSESESGEKSYDLKIVNNWGLDKIVQMFYTMQTNIVQTF